MHLRPVGHRRADALLQPTRHAPPLDYDYRPYPVVIQPYYAELRPHTPHQDMYLGNSDNYCSVNYSPASNYRRSRTSLPGDPIPRQAVWLATTAGSLHPSSDRGCPDMATKRPPLRALDAHSRRSWRPRRSGIGCAVYLDEPSCLRRPARKGPPFPLSRPALLDGESPVGHTCAVDQERPGPGTRTRARMECARLRHKT